MLVDALREPVGDKAELSPSQFRAFLATNRRSTEYFIFYLRGKEKLWAVGACWSASLGGWFVYASPVSSLSGWGAGGWVLSQV